MPAPDAKQYLCRPVSDAAHKTADTVNKGVDKAHEGQRKVYESSASQGDVKVEGREALESAKDSAVHAKCAISLPQRNSHIFLDTMGLLCSAESYFVQSDMGYPWTPSYVCMCRCYFHLQV